MRSQKLHHGLETVCLSYQDEHNVYAIGSRSHTTILDARTLQPIQNKNIISLFPTCGNLLYLFINYFFVFSIHSIGE